MEQVAACLEGIDNPKVAQSIVTELKHRAAIVPERILRCSAKYTSGELNVDIWLEADSVSDAETKTLDVIQDVVTFTGNTLMVQDLWVAGEAINYSYCTSPRSESKGTVVNLTYLEGKL